MRASSCLRFFDRYFGIPLVFFLGLLTRKQKAPRSLNQIALLHTAAIGDTILLSAVIADLQATFPKAQIIFFSGPSNFSAASLIPHIQVIEIPVINPFRAFSLIRKHQFDLWIDFGQWPRLNAILSYFAKASFKIGFETPGQFRHYVYDQTVLHQPIHELENFRHLVQLASVSPTHLPSILPLSAEPSSYFILHMFAGGSRAKWKQWPQERWIALINWLTLRGFPVLLTGSKQDAKKCEEVRLACQLPDEITVKAGRSSLYETASLIKSARAVISVDTGVMHLAAAIGAPTVALHGPTSPERWGGIGPKVAAVSAAKQTKQSIHLGFEKPSPSDFPMEQISVEQVLDALFFQVLR